MNLFKRSVDLAIKGVSTKSIIEAIIEVAESSNTNIGTVNVEEAYSIAKKWFEENDQDIDKILPKFKPNYIRMQKLIKAAPNIKRADMPVIEPEDMSAFEKALKTGRLDLFRPRGKSKLPQFPTSPLKGDDGEEWVNLGLKDGDKKDDIVKAKIVQQKVGNLKPIQNQVWLGKTIPLIIKYGAPGRGSQVLSKTVITSAEGYILDGHHRWSQSMITDPGLSARTLKVPLDLKFLLKMGRAYSYAIGHNPKT